jgi:hypothetical protein
MNHEVQRRLTAYNGVVKLFFRKKVKPHSKIIGQEEIAFEPANDAREVMPYFLATFFDLVSPLYYKTPKKK